VDHRLLLQPADEVVIILFIGIRRGRAASENSALASDSMLSRLIRMATEP
jgi:hypothetical protein